MPSTSQIHRGASPRLNRISVTLSGKHSTQTLCYGAGRKKNFNKKIELYVRATAKTGKLWDNRLLIANKSHERKQLFFGQKLTKTVQIWFNSIGHSRANKQNQFQPVQAAPPPLSKMSSPGAAARGGHARRGAGRGAETVF